MSATAAEPTAGRRRLGLPVVVLALAQLVISLDHSIVHVALPEIGAGLGFLDHDLQWVVSAYVVTTGGFLLLGGRAADLLGRRRMFVLATAIYAASSLVGGLAPSPGVLLAVRAAQGIGGSLLFPATLSLITTTYAEGPVRNRALALWGAAGAGGLCFGSLLGGVLVHAYGWPSVFLVNVPIALALAVSGRLLFPADPPRDRTRRFDAAGALTATAGLTLIVFLLVHAPAAGWTSTAALLAAAGGLVLLALFAVVERRTPDPLVPVRLFRHRGLVLATVVAALFSATFSSLPYFLTLYFQSVRGYDAFVTGLCFLLPAVVVAAGTQAGPPAVARFGMRRLLAGGLAGGAVGALALVPAVAADGSYLSLLPGIVLVSLGQGSAWTALWIAAASGVAPGDQGIASGIASTSLQAGGAVGLALLVAAAASGVGRQSAAADLLDGIRTALSVMAGALALGALAVLATRRATSP
ncbi:MFS transporter [Streptomyces sp. NRRL_ISP-5395]|uniref:MFS transporter n=1 Tax=Streptomyces TaxID=1883 RepID=UPI00187444FE|nr:MULTISPECIES: MFS transporter [Streptomyces]MDX2670861.1 MFS transporter [Streptomyces sp. NRRL_ISP-5395]GHF77085.1 MFS transporter [Streptomyces griseus]